MKIAPLAAIALLLGAARFSPAAPDERMIPEPAAPADRFVETIGVATHWGFRNTIYHKKWDELHPLLGSLGVRNVRDSLDGRMDDLWRLYGIRAIVVVEPDAPWDRFLADWRQKRHLIAALEGPNEVNGSWAKLGKSYQGKGWPDGARAFQDDLFKNVKADPLLSAIPVLAPSLYNKGAGPEIAPLRSFDYANAHSYAGGEMPSRSIDFRDPFLMLGRGATLPILAATESGYHTCLGNSKVIAGSQAGVSHNAHRKYIPRQIAEYFNAGYHWTVIYEFAAGRPNKAEQEDPEAAFGLLMPDGTPKPGYYALKSLIGLVGESKWDASTGQWVRPPQRPAAALAFALRGAPPTLHHVLLQRSDGTFQLLLWNEVSSFDLKKKEDIANPEAVVTLALGQKAESVTVSRLASDDRPVASEKWESVQEVKISVPDELIVVGIQRAGSPPAALQTPAGITATTTANSIDLHWPTAPGVDAYWVSLNGRNLGPAEMSPDGKAHFAMTRLVPAMTYRYEIVAVSTAGGVSPAAAVSATTTDAFPDLVVKNLRTIPESPKEGDTISFVATVENRGSIATEEGILIGTKFAANGKTICWSDTLRGPLAPGQQVEVRANSGPTGQTTWRVPRGTHQLTAFVDDVNRIAESSETNNKAKLKISTGAGPDLVVTEVKPAAREAGKPPVFEVTLHNRGNDPVPTGLTVSVSLYQIDASPAKPIGFATSRDPLPPDGRLTLKVAAPAGLAAGAHRLRAVVDDVDRIGELDETNNQAEFELTLAPSP